MFFGETKMLFMASLWELPFGIFMYMQQTKHTNANKKNNHNTVLPYNTANIQKVEKFTF